MNKLLEPPPGIVEVVARYECPPCGNSCSCGVPYTAKTALATKYAEQNPTASVRQIAKETGVSLGTAYNAKSGVQSEHVTTGRDGKTYPATKHQQEPTARPELPGLIVQANKHLDRILPLIRQMKPHERILFRNTALRKMADAQPTRRMRKA